MRISERVFDFKKEALNFFSISEKTDIEHERLQRKACERSRILKHRIKESLKENLINKINI